MQAFIKRINSIGIKTTFSSNCRHFGNFDFLFSFSWVTFHYIFMQIIRHILMF